MESKRSLNGKKSKDKVGVISIESKSGSQGLVITCQDDGRGIDISKFSDSYNPQAAIDRIFDVGASSKSEATKISGRGVRIAGN